MSNYYKGFAVIKGVAGNVKVAGRADMLNSTPSATLTSASPVSEHTDSEGVPRTLTRPFKRWTVDLEITPGIGASKTPAQVKVLAESVEHGDALILSGFPINALGGDVAAASDLSTSWGSAIGCIVVGTPTINLTTDGLLTMRITGQRTLQNDDTAVDFATAGWATV